MRAVFLAMGMMACGGDGDAGTDTSGEPGTNPLTIPGGGGGPGDPCAGFPAFELQGMSCDELGFAFHDAVDAADICDGPADCRVLQPQCEDWNQVSCFYPVNDCFSQTLMSEFDAEADGCIYEADAVCQCSGFPQVDCVNGRCQFVYE